MINELSPLRNLILIHFAATMASLLASEVILSFCPMIAHKFVVGKIVKTQGRRGMVLHRTF